MPKKAARKTGKALSQTYAFWFRKTYQLAPTDPRYLAMTEEDVMTEFWAYELSNRDSSEEEIEDEEFDLDEVLAGIEAEGEQWETVIDDRPENLD